MNDEQEGRYSVLYSAAWALFLVGLGIALIGGVFWFDEPGARRPVAAVHADITVFANRHCDCCHKWIEYLEASGLTVAVRDVETTGPVRSRLGIPESMASCHTAVVGKFWIEGHVPADLVERLLAESPSSVAGIAVPGMPIGSPGMEGPNPVTYDIVAYGSDGKSHVYATRQGHLEPHHE